ncbi:MAG: cytochrome C peroxidase, partial [Verrucomicrobia bacterium]|nr:cytochrome C peroxidase [Verrucomicrobiota bacterium]
MTQILATLVFLLTVAFASAAPLHLTFTHLDGEKPLLFDSLRYQNTAGESYSSTRLSYLVSDVTLHRGADQPAITDPTIGFIDAPRSRTRLTIPHVPPGTYTALSFLLGLNEETNHADPAQFTANHPLNPNLNNLHWDWQGGYIFLAMEGHWRKPGAKFPDGYAYHFANDHNRTRITLPAPIEITGETEIHLALDLAKLLSGLSFESDGPTTHSQAG